MKITGRYFVEGLDAVLDTVDADIVVQSTESPWSLGDGVLRSEVVGFDGTLLDALLGGQDEVEGPARGAHALRGVQKLERSGRDRRALPAPEGAADAERGAEHAWFLTVNGCVAGFVSGQNSGKKSSA